MAESHYIPTTPGTLSLFAADTYADPSTMDQRAAQAAYAEYLEHLISQYRNSSVKASRTTVYFGVAQQINRLIYAARYNGARLVFGGPFAPAAAQAFLELAAGTLRIEDEFPDVVIISAVEEVAA